MKGLIDAVLTSPVDAYKNKAWFFKGGQYMRYDFQADKADGGYPQPAAAWGPELAAGVDGACNGQQAFAGKSYFFKGGQYFRFDWGSETIDQPAKPISAWGLSGAFVSGIDAALDGRGAFAGKTYFFKGDKYARFDWAADSVDLSNQPITAWGLTGDFAAGIDAVVNGMGPSAGKAYFFKGNRYVRFDWATDQVDSGPRVIAPNWQGLGELLLAIRGGYPAAYSDFVAQGRIDDDIADLLNELLAFPADSWARQTAQFAHHELFNNNLVGIVRADNAEKLRPFLAPAHHGILDAVRAAGGTIADNGVTHAIDDGGGFLRGFILMNNDEMDRAVPGGDLRTFMHLVVAHELTHFRNRVPVRTMNNDAALDGSRYADPVLAGGFANTHFTRSLFINELASRHVAWHVQRDLQHAAAALAKGQFFNAANAFALACVRPRGDYGDNGYMQALVLQPTAFNRQVGLWIRDMDNMLYHDDPVKNAQAQQFIRDEIAFVQPSFVPPLVLPDGMA